MPFSFLTPFESHITAVLFLSVRKTRIPCCSSFIFIRYVSPVCSERNHEEEYISTISPQRIA